jgi:hypothetical protein
VVDEAVNDGEDNLGGKRFLLLTLANTPFRRCLFLLFGSSNRWTIFW